MFDSELSKGILQHYKPELSPAGDPDSFDLYIRDTTASTYELLTTQHPLVPLGGQATPMFNWASSNLEHVLFSTFSNTSEGPLRYFPGVDQAAYLSSGGVVTVASIMPGSSDPFSAAAPGYGTHPEVGRMPGNGGTYRSISEDGSRVFFTAPSTGPAMAPADFAKLYVRTDHGTATAETIQVSAPEPGVVDPDGPQSAFYRGASVDGSKVFFTSCQKLTADSTADHDDGDPETLSDVDGRCNRIDLGVKPDLYLYDLDAAEGAGDLIDLTTQDPSGAVVLGVIGASEDGSRFYFVARGNLAPGAVPGEPNLYLWEEDGTPDGDLTLVATLSPGDTEVWEPDKFDLPESMLTPDGSRLAFAASVQLDPMDTDSSLDVYLYDAVADQLACASCSSESGGPTEVDATLKPHGAQTHNQPDIQPSETSDLIARNLTDDGARLYFETPEVLVPADINEKADVYEYDADADQINLISSGTSDFDSGFHGASPTGDDVFFTTRERLTGWDTDDLRDIYDARVAGGFPEPPHSSLLARVKPAAAPAPTPRPAPDLVLPPSRGRATASRPSGAIALR